MTQKDLSLLEQAYETTYRSTFRRLIMEADTEECREAIHNIMRSREVELEDWYMKMRRIRIVADSCPLKRKNCDTCKYCNGTEGNKVYCHYNDKDWSV